MRMRLPARPSWKLSKSPCVPLPSQLPTTGDRIGRASAESGNNAATARQTTPTWARRKPMAEPIECVCAALPPSPWGRLRSRHVSASSDPYVLPADLPVPEDDGAADHLRDTKLPDLELPSSQGTVKIRDFEVLYVYPRSGRPGVPMLPGWDAIPGARGCTPQSCAFRDHASELAELGAHVAGLSAQTLDDQIEFAERNHMPFPVISDEHLRLAGMLRLPTFDVAGLTLYRRLTLIAEQGRIVKVFYPVFPPDRNAQDVVDWLRHRH